MWGYENTDIIEKVHTKFCKFIFGVSKCSHNMPIYGELGCYPLSITIKQRMVCYWTRILKSNQHKLNKVMYEILYNLHCKDIQQVLRLEHADLVRSFQTLKRHKMRAYEDRMQERAIMRSENDSMDFWCMWRGNRACGARMNVTPGAWEAHFLALFRAESPPILQLDGDVRVEELDEQITETKFVSRLNEAKTERRLVQTV